MRQYINSHWFWFFVLFGCYRLYDFIEHIQRAGSLYAQFPSEWFLFSFVSACTFCLIIYFSSRLFSLVKLPGLVADLVAFCLALILHLWATGPFWNQLLWPHDVLYFMMSYQVIAVGLLAYIVYRILFLIVFSMAKGRN